MRCKKTVVLNYNLREFTPNIPPNPPAEIIKRALVKVSKDTDSPTAMSPPKKIITNSVNPAAVPNRSPFLWWIFPAINPETNELITVDINIIASRNSYGIQPFFKINKDVAIRSAVHKAEPHTVPIIIGLAAVLLTDFLPDLRINISP